MKSIFNQKIILITILLLSVCFMYPVLKDGGEPKSFQLTATQLLKKEGKWYYFKKGAKITIRELIEKNYEFFDLPQGVSSNIEKEDVDEFGMKHYLLKLEMYGIPIEDAFYTAHYSKDGELLHVVGDYDKNVIPKEKTIPKITPQEAFELAKNEFFSSEKIIFQDLIKIINKELNDFYKSGIISPKIVYFRPDKKILLKLCYKVDVLSDELGSFKTVYIDALTSSVIKVIDHRAFAIATVQTVYNGSRTVQVEWRGWPYKYYYLRHEGFPTPIETRNSSIRDDYPYCRPWGFGNLDRVYKDDLNWPLDFKCNAASSHWAVQEAYKVFKNTYGRTYGTYSSSGGDIRVENNYNSYYNGVAGPFYYGDVNSDYIHIGNTIGATNGFEGSLDVIAHEFTHGVMYRSRGVDGAVYYPPSNEEAGALCESFSDIFAIMVEYFTLGTTDYIVGSNLVDYFKRSLQNPRTYQHYSFVPLNNVDCVYQITNLTNSTVPLYYHEYPYWIYGYGLGPAHTNNSVQNYWFYLLANGGFQLGVTVNGIGINSASRITYRNMVYYFSPVSTFNDMRQASIVNASVLFGECSNEYTQTINAWAAVGVGPASEPCIHTEIIGPESLICGEVGYFYANTTGGSGSYSYNWYVDYTYYSSASSISLSFYPQYSGEYHYIILEVSDGSVTDTDDHTLYVYSCGEGGSQKNIENLTFKLYPNPASTITKVEIGDELIKDSEQYTIQIINRNGRVVFLDRSYKKEYTINTSSFQKGMYSIIIKKGHKFGSTNLIIK